MSEVIKLSHSASSLVYHFVCPAKYRRNVFDVNVDNEIKEICREIENKYDIRFLEVGTDKNHVHFLIQTIPKLSPSQVIKVVKSITAKEVFKRCLEVKQKLWGGEFWSDGFYVSTVGQHGSEKTIQEYVKNQGKEKEYTQLLQQEQLNFFE